MTGPGWLSAVFAALMLTVAAYCTGRLLTARQWHRPTELDTDGAHILMGVAMAGMLVTGLRTLPAAIWTGIFVVGASWFGAQALRARRGVPATPWRTPHPGPHLLECAAMLYMLLLAAGSRFSLLALMLALSLLGWVVRLADRLTVHVPALAAPLGLPAASLPGPLALAAAPRPTDAQPDDCAAPATAARRPLAPRCATLCKIAMGITMGYMLILML